MRPGWHVRVHVLARRLWGWIEHFGPPLAAAALALAVAALLVSPRWQQVVEVTHHLLRNGQGIERLSDLASFPPVLVGFALAVMGAGLLARARLAWAMSLLLALLAAGLALWSARQVNAVFVLAAVLIVVLLLWAQRFSRSSLAAGSLFALLGVGSLLVYAVLGVLWFGDGFSPPIKTLNTALYVAVVTMSTVGYGDIVPKTDAARLFVVSLIVLGITVFATTLSVVIGPLIGGTLKRTLEKRMQHRTRKDHVVLIGASTLAQALARALSERAVPVTMIIADTASNPYAEEADVIHGDATQPDILREARVTKARAVLVLRDDDADNAFIVLAVKEVAPRVRTVAAVQDARNVDKVRRVGPDLVFAPQLLGGELLVRTLLGEPIDNTLIDNLLAAKTSV
jgi:voltage-gated potassium channel